MDDDELDRLLRALGDATRRRLLDRLRDAPGLTLSALGEGVELSRQAISKHHHTKMRVYLDVYPCLCW